VGKGWVGTVTRVSEQSVFVRWHESAVEDELDCEEVVSTGAFQKRVPHHARALEGSEDPKLVTFYDDEKKSSYVYEGCIGCRRDREQDGPATG
jgi:hypothetical protein